MVTLNNAQFQGALGLAMKAGKVVSGEFQTEKAIKELKAQLVIVAQDASGNTRKHFTDMCSFRDIPITDGPMMEDLGRAIGKEMRSVVGITDHGFAESIRKKLK